MKKNDKEISISKQKLTVTNLEKIYFPKDRITKGEIIDYYRKISKYILPYLKGRPQSLNRHVNGIAGPAFYQKDMHVDKIPKWLKTERIYSKSNEDYIDYLICNDTATLVYMANLGCIEINPWHSTTEEPDYPDYMIMDLDPAKIDFRYVVDTAKVIREICDELKIPCYCKTSGSTGLHVYIPMGKKYSYDEIKLFGELLATETHHRLPDITSIERATAKRKTKIYVDFLQNRKGQTIASAYSVRPKPGATVSAPLEWDEVNHQLKLSDYTIYTIFDRLEKKGDLWKGVLRKGIDLEKVMKRMEKMMAGR